MFPSESQISGKLFPEAIAVVAGGGALGAAGRWAIGALIGSTPGTWPWPTVLVNLVGCLLIGFAAARLLRGSRGWDFVVTGVLGGFTTMSAFAVELNDLVDYERSGLAVTYALVTIGGGVGATMFANLASSAPSVPTAPVSDAEPSGGAE